MMSMPSDVAANCQIFLTTALELFRLGAVPVLLGIRDKRPIWKNWQQWALSGELTITEAILHHWHEGHPGHNVGMALGHGWIAIDIDHLEAVEAMILGLVPTGAPAKRARRGYTLIFRDDPADPVRKTRTFLHPVSGDMLVEVLALGRQTVMPPSIHPEGMPYEWLSGGIASLASAPMIGQRHIDAIEAALGAAGLTKMRHQRKGVVEDFQGRRERYSAWLDVKLRDKLAAVRGAMEGGRQQALNDAVLPLACFIRVGLVDETKLRAAMEDACEENGYMRAHGFSRFSRDFDKAVTDGWDMSLPALDTAIGEVDQTAARLMGEAPPVPIMPSGGGGVVELSHLDLISVTDLLKMPVPDRLWTLGDWIPHKQVTLLYGDGGSGKTDLLIQLTVLASMGLSFMGMPMTRRRVLFISAEDEMPELHFRIARTCRALGCDGENIKVTTLVELEDTELVSPDIGGKIKPTALMDRVVSACQGFDMVIMDPVADLFGGNEVDKRQVRGFIQIIRKRIAFEMASTVIIAAHPSETGMKSGKGTSGSVAWSNSVKARLYFEKAGDDVMRLSLAKANRAKAGAEILMKWVNGIFLPATKPSEIKAVEIEGRPRELLIDEIRKRPFTYRLSSQSTDLWVGRMAGPILGIDYQSPDGKKRINRVIDQLIQEGVLKIEHIKGRGPSEQRPVVNVCDVSRDSSTSTSEN